MDISTIISIVTVIVAYVLGIISKKSEFVKNEIIPLQNLLVGIIATIIEYAITKDFNASMLAVGLFAGGLYDIPNNLKKLSNNEKEV